MDTDKDGHVNMNEWLQSYATVAQVILHRSTAVPEAAMGLPPPKPEAVKPALRKDIDRVKAKLKAQNLIIAQGRTPATAMNREAAGERLRDRDASRYVMRHKEEKKMETALFTAQTIPRLRTQDRWDCLRGEEHSCRGRLQQLHGRYVEQTKLSGSSRLKTTNCSCSLKHQTNSCRAPLRLALIRLATDIRRCSYGALLGLDGRCFEVMLCRCTVRSHGQR